MKEEKTGGREGEEEDELYYVICMKVRPRLALSNMMPNKIQGQANIDIKKGIPPDIANHCFFKNLVVNSCLVLGYPTL